MQKDQILYESGDVQLRWLDDNCWGVGKEREIQKGKNKGVKVFAPKYYSRLSDGVIALAKAITNEQDIKTLQTYVNAFKQAKQDIINAIEA